MRTAEMDEDCRCRIEHGLNDEIGAVDVRCADDLDISLGRAIVLTYESCNILIDIGSKNGLDHEYMVPALDCFHDTQIIHVTVIVQIKVGKHEGVIVEKVLELLDRVRLRKCRANGLKVEVQRDILTCCNHACGRGDRMCPGHCHGRVIGARAAYVRRLSDNPCRAAARSHCKKGQNVQITSHRSVCVISFLQI